jgi:hypothetical protein
VRNGPIEVKEASRVEITERGVLEAATSSLPTTSTAGFDIGVDRRQGGRMEECYVSFRGEKRGVRGRRRDVKLQQLLKVKGGGVRCDRDLVVTWVAVGALRQRR